MRKAQRSKPVRQSCGNKPSSWSGSEKSWRPGSTKARQGCDCCASPRSGSSRQSKNSGPRRCTLFSINLSDSKYGNVCTPNVNSCYKTSRKISPSKQLHDQVLADHARQETNAYRSVGQSQSVSVPAKSIPITPGAMATPEGIAKVKENKVATKQLKETFERMKELEARSKQHQVLEERLKRISLVLEKQKQEEEAQRILALELAQKNEEVVKHNQRIIQELAKLEHEEKVREEVLKARQAVRQQYAIEVEDLRYKGLSDIPKEKLLDMKESEERVDLLKVPIVSDVPQASKHPKTAKGPISQRQSFQKSPVSQKVTAVVGHVSPQASRSPVVTKQPQVAVSQGKTSNISSSISGLGPKPQAASKEPKASIAVKKPKESLQTSTSYRAPKVKEISSAYSSNGMPTKFSTQPKEKSPRVRSREHASISDRKKPSWNASTNNSASRKVVDQLTPAGSGNSNTPQKPHLKSQRAQQSALDELTKKVQHLKAEKRAAQAGITSAKPAAQAQKRSDSSTSRGQSTTSRSKALHGLIPNIKKEYEPALARSRTPKGREEVNLKKQLPSERNSQDTDQTSRFGALEPIEKAPMTHQAHKPEDSHLGSAWHHARPTSTSREPAFLSGLNESAGEGEFPRPFLRPIPLLTESQVAIPAVMARDQSESELQTTGTFYQPQQELKSGEALNYSGVQPTGPQHIKLVWSSANLGSSQSNAPHTH